MPPKTLRPKPHNQPEERFPGVAFPDPPLRNVDEKPGATVPADPPVTEPAQESEVYVGKPVKYVKGIKKWGKRCKECEVSYLHDEVRFCSSKRCSHRCPKRLRPQFRPNIQVPKAAPTEFEKVITKQVLIQIAGYPTWEEVCLKDAIVQVEWLRGFVAMKLGKGANA